MSDWNETIQAMTLAEATKWDTTCPADKRQCDKVPCPYRARCIKNNGGLK